MKLKWSKMNGKIPIMMIICLLAAAFPGRGALLLDQWAVEGSAQSIAVGPDGQIYVTINNNHKVVKYSPNGELLAEWTLEEMPSGIAVGPGGEVYVTINNNHKVVKYSSSGEFLAEWPVDGTATGIAAGSDGQVYLAFSNGVVQIYDGRQ